VRRALILTAAVLAAVFLWLVATLPPAAAPASSSQLSANSLARWTAPGAFHVHSTRSDGVGDREAIAAAAARAGLRFVVITDHGDGTRSPDPPAYLHGVLCFDGVEISTNGGHYAAVDLPAAPYPLGGEPSAVVEDVRRLGGFGVAAHPDSAKPSLRWTDWSAPVDGVEWLNLDSEWRDERNDRLARVVFDYPFRRGPALASVLDRPVASLDHWDALASRHRMVGLAAHDAHGGWSQRAEDGGRRGVPGMPSYEASFRTFAIRAVLDDELSGAAERDARIILRALRSGRVFTAVDAVAGPAFVDFQGTSGAATAVMGQEIPFVEGAQLWFRSTLPAGGTITLRRNGKAILDVGSSELRVTAPGPGAYRVEVNAPHAPGVPPVPWIVTNPIYLSAGALSRGPAAPAIRPIAEVVDAGVIEKDGGSTGALSSDRRRWALSYRLRPDDRASQYVALAVPLNAGHPEFDGLLFTGSSSAPARVSVQVRFDSAGGARWAHSVYLSPQTNRISLSMDQLVPVDRVSQRPRMSAASSILFVVDLTNARPGTAGEFQISNLALGTVQKN
jgi:hypothetical protein